MSSSHYFELYGPPIIPTKELLRDILDCFFKHGFEFETNPVIGPKGKTLWDEEFFMKQERVLGYHDNNIMFTRFQTEKEFNLIFQMVEQKSEHVYFSISPNGDDYSTSGIPTGFCTIMTDQLRRIWDDEESQFRWRLVKRFQRVMDVLKPLATVLKSYYGYAYDGESSPEFFTKYIQHGKARYPFDVTFWGAGYPTRPSPAVQHELTQIGYQIENNEAGTWMYLPVEKWLTESFKLDSARLQKLLQYDIDEGYSSILWRPNSK